MVPSLVDLGQLLGGDLAFPTANLSGVALAGVLAAMGLCVGTLTGLFGVGGAFAIAPLMNVLLGIDYTLAVGCSLCFTIGTSAAGWAGYRRRGNIASKTMLILAGSSICGTVLGSMLHEEAVQGLGSHFTLLMHGLFIGILVLTIWLVLRPAPRTEGRSLLQRLPLGPYIRIRQASLEHISLSGLCGTGLCVGVLSGMMGIGGGVILMPILLLVVGLGARAAAGTSLGVVLLNSIAGAALYGQGGHVSLPIAMTLLVGSTLGVQVGIALAYKLNTAHTRRYFAIFAAAVAAVLIWDLSRKIL